MSLQNYLPNKKWFFKKKLKISLGNILFCTFFRGFNKTNNCIFNQQEANHRAPWQLNSSFTHFRRHKFNLLHACTTDDLHQENEMPRFDNFFLFFFTVSLPNAIACHPGQLQCPGIWSSWSTHGWFRPTQLAWWLDCSCWHWHHSLLSHCALKVCGVLKEQPERTWDGPEVRDGDSLSITALFTTNSKTLYASVVYCTDGNRCVVRQSLFENASAIVSCQAWCEALHVSMVKSLFVHLIVEGLSEANWTGSCGELKHLANDAAKVDRSRARFKWGVQAKQHGVGRVTVGVSANLTVRPDWKKRSATQKASSLVSQFHFWGSLKKWKKRIFQRQSRFIKTSNPWCARACTSCKTKEGDQGGGSRWCKLWSAIWEARLKGYALPPTMLESAKHAAQELGGDSCYSTSIAGQI